MFYTNIEICLFQEIKNVWMIEMTFSETQVIVMYTINIVNNMIMLIEHIPSLIQSTLKGINASSYPECFCTITSLKTMLDKMNSHLNMVWWLQFPVSNQVGILLSSTAWLELGIYKHVLLDSVHTFKFSMHEYFSMKQNAFDKSNSKIILDFYQDNQKDIVCLIEQI